MKSKPHLDPVIRDQWPVASDGLGDLGEKGNEEKRRKRKKKNASTPSFNFLKVSDGKSNKVFP